MEIILSNIKQCIEKGKTDKNSPYPPDMKGKEGADEWTKEALNNNIKATAILNEALIPAMKIVGNQFRENKIFVPQVLMSAKAMNTAMQHLKPFFLSGEVERKGTFIIGTVAGDLHDIGKNLVSMIFEGAGWEVIDLGVDVKTETFIETIEQKPGSVVGLSAMLTTTMENMAKTVQSIKEKHPKQTVLIGGAPVSMNFCRETGADFYSPDPQGAVDFLDRKK